mmetsp:Transcript_79609/g.170714  ORF Transcript_79609/g.170714 Transcript_79609/m.170714 type:complete len:340 (-) Transcript_79609:92-1111(-)
MPVIAVITDVASPNGKKLQDFFPELDGRAEYIVGNDLATFTAYPRLGEIDVIVAAGFPPGNVAVLTELWPLCPKVKWVHSVLAGVDTVVPLLNALPGGPEIPLTNAKGAFSRSLAEYAMAAMLYFNKQLPRLQQNRMSRNWDRFIMNELHGKTVGFIGFGDIAQATAVVCKAFGMKVAALRNTRNLSGNDLADMVYYASDQENGSGKSEVFRTADFVVCTLPGGPATKYACGRDEFAVMKPSGVFISMGRGTCVDEAALVEALREGRIAGAALDVFEKEPLAAESPLWDCENLLLSPHNADLTATYLRQTWDLFLEKLTSYSDPGFAGFSSVVDKEKGY